MRFGVGDGVLRVAGWDGVVGYSLFQHLLREEGGWSPLGCTPRPCLVGSPKLGGGARILRVPVLCGEMRSMRVFHWGSRYVCVP